MIIELLLGVSTTLVVRERVEVVPYLLTDPQDCDDKHTDSDAEEHPSYAGECAKRGIADVSHAKNECGEGKTEEDA
jgi:hypothetical protein